MNLKQKYLENRNNIWKSYIFEPKSDIEQLIKALHKKKWTVQSIIPTAGIIDRGEFETIQISALKYVLLVRVISRSSKIRGFHRFVFILSERVLLAEQVNEHTPTIQKMLLSDELNLKNITEVRINVMINRKLADNKKEFPIRATFKSDIESLGIAGLKRITFEGENLVEGFRTLQSRREISINVNSLGPLIIIETKSMIFELSTGIKLKEMTPETLDLLIECIKDQLLKKLSNT
jgi:hypothetical protein